MDNCLFGWVDEKFGDSSLTILHHNDEGARLPYTQVVGCCSCFPDPEPLDRSIFPLIEKTAILNAHLLNAHRYIDRSGQKICEDGRTRKSECTYSRHRELDTGHAVLVLANLHGVGIHWHSVNDFLARIVGWHQVSIVGMQVTARAYLDVETHRLLVFSLSLLQ